MICPTPSAPRQPRAALDFAIVAELSALHELSALALAENEEQLAQEAVEKVTRLFGTRRFAMLTGRSPQQRLIVSSGFQPSEDVVARLQNPAVQPNQLLLVFNRNQDDQDILFFEQSHPMDNRIRRLCNVLASRLEARLAAFRQDEQRQRMEQALRESETRNQALLDAIPDLMFVYDRDGTYLDYHASNPDLLIAPPAQFIGQSIHTILPKPVAEEHLRNFALALETGTVQLTEYSLELNGKTCDFEGRITPLGNQRLLVIARDITDRKRADAERETLQSQLSQAQKMESVGRLAGGVAHDFNNMLGVILGHAELAMESPGTPETLREHMTEIQKAGQRSANLTRQLLAFARKQPVAPQVFDLNPSVEDILKMLRRLIGEQTELAWHPGPDAGRVKMDPSQLDQILTNLCINARDALGTTGRITIETAAASIGGDSGTPLKGATPGDYVRLTVSDNGTGMDDATLAHIFEPFFSTKDTGKGTGLGLATVYGAVQQNNGFIDVHSKPGQGTTFQIYLPRPMDPASPIPDTLPSPPPAASNHETILLLEDEPAVLALTSKLLSRLGYSVLAAATPQEALRIARSHSGPIGLLITDVVMPGMNGFELAKALRPIRPEIRNLYMSGYIANTLDRLREKDQPIHFIQKPFTKDKLASAVHEAFSEPA